MSEELFIGIDRGFGIARIQFQKKFPEFSNKNKIDKRFEKFSTTKLEKVNYIQFDKDSEIIKFICLKLFEILDTGGICVSKELIKEESKLLGFLFSEKIIKNYLKQDSSILVEEFDSYYFKKNYFLEKKIAENFTKRFLIHIKETFKEYKSNFLSDEQLSVVNQILNYTISILSGGPGTGKTKTIKSIIEHAIQNGIETKKIALISPTGKAAKRLNESIKEILLTETDLNEAKTIHRYLEYSVNQNKFKKNKDNQVDDELIILDESSMIDLELIESLLAAVPISNKNKFIFVGDPNQLLSVNKGAIFNDLFELGENCFQLTKTFRQSNKDGNEILNFSKSILEGKELEKFIQPKSEISTEGVNFYEVENEEELHKILKIWKSKIETITNDYQILTPFRETKIGTKKLNEVLEINKKKYKAILNSNLYEYNIFNGEIGEIILNEENFTFQTGENIFTLPNSYLQYFELGYVITIHKSQGSEYEHILVVLPIDEGQESQILNKRLFYTAVTRAKKSVGILGIKNSLHNIINSEEVKRFSNLEKRIKPLLLK